MAHEKETSSSPQNSSGRPSLLYVLFSALGVLWLFSKLRAPKEHGQNSVPPQSSTGEEKNAGRSQSTIVPQVTPFPSHRGESNGDTKQTPLWKKFAEISIAAATVGLFFVTFAYTWVSYNQWQTAKDTLVATERPWVKLIDVNTRGNNPIVPALSFQRSPAWPKDTQQVTFQVDVSYRNVGRSVTRVTVDFWLFLELWKNGYDDAIRKDGKEFCDSHNVVDKNLSVTVYPGDEPLHWYGGAANVVKPENTNYFTDRNPGVGFIVPSLAVCVNYQFGDSPKVYQTRAFYEIFRQDDRTRFFEVGVGRPEKDIFLVRYPYLDAAY